MRRGCGAPCACSRLDWVRQASLGGGTPQMLLLLLLGPPGLHLRELGPTNPCPLSLHRWTQRLSLCLRIDPCGHFRMAASGRAVPASMPVPGAAVLAGPLQHCQVAVARCCIACIAVPGAALLARPLQHSQVVTEGCVAARKRIPAAVVLAGPLQHCQVAAARCVAASGHIPRAALLVGPLQHATSPAGLCVRIAADPPRPRGGGNTRACAELDPPPRSLHQLNNRSTYNKSGRSICLRSPRTSCILYHPFRVE